MAADTDDPASEPSVAVTFVAERHAEAQLLARNLGLDLVPLNSKEHEFHLVLTTDRLELVMPRNTPRLAISVDYIEGVIGHRRRQGGGTGQAVARAVGIRGAYRPKVLDATLGLGRDAIMLTWLGCHVTGIERSPFIAALVHDGLLRASMDHLLAPVIQERFSLVVADSIRYIGHLEGDERPDVIYLDPMFPERQKSALVKKEMRVLQALVKDDADSPALLEAALAKAKRRVVVKRPRHAPPLDGPRPGAAIAGKTVRFDLYPRMSEM
ncbi:MAG: class I SAM-dependent methyltransferase [Planctomycetes bacterium]|nr:class I SAM-dependent methyltransferase [Planctomycetota bacterium]NUQ33415.1 class I SAM-dependent methyltransferase [Planctomycetaceae bacterium]